MKILKVKCLAPTRLDNYLTQQYPALTPGRLNKALRENKIKLNGKKQPLSTRVMAGDEIKLFILDDVLDADRRVDGPAWKNARGPAQVVYDCPQILIVNKPAGLAVDGPDDDTLLNRALLYLSQQGEYKENDVYTPALCHRLDTGTSGLVIIAKTPAARWGTTEDLVGPAVFLASDASDFVNGHVLYVDGGILAYIGKQPK